MVVINRNRNTAIAVKRTKYAVLLVLMKSGRLATAYVQQETFASTWQELKEPLDSAIEKFCLHAQKNGATQSALNALKKLKEGQAGASMRLF